jgi:hypothetical protein
LSERLSSEADLVVPHLWLWLLDELRAAYGFGVLDPRRSQAYIDSKVVLHLMRIDEVLSILFPDDCDRRRAAIATLATLIDAEIDWTIRNTGKPAPSSLFDGQRLFHDTDGLVLPLAPHWKPDLDAERIRSMFERAIAVGVPISAYHEAVVLNSCDRFEAHLQSLEERHRDPIVRKTAAVVRQTYVSARAQRLDLEVEHVLVNPVAVRRVLREHRELFLNQWALGIGRDDAPVVVLGAEHAYNVERDADLVNLCSESIGSGILWLCGGRNDVVNALSGGAITTARPFHVHPNDHYQEGSMHTWERLGRALGAPGVHEPRSVPGLGDLCYQIELSAQPSQDTSGSEPPTAARRLFLRSVMEHVRETASVLIIHGSQSSRAHEAVRLELASVFLGGPCERALSQRHPLSERYRPISVADIGERRVIRTRALSNQGCTDEFCDNLAALVSEAIDEGT